MKKQEQRIVMIAILGAIVIRQAFEILMISVVPGFGEINVMIRFLMTLAVAILAYIVIIRWMKKKI